MIRHGLLRQTLGNARRLRPHGAIGPYVTFLDLADGASPQCLHPLAHAGAGSALVAHLRTNLIFLRQQPHLARFPNGVRHRLLTINVNALIHGADGSWGMGVIRGRHSTGINVLAHLVEHLAEVGKFFRLRKLAGCATATVEITITKRDHLADLPGTFNIASALAAHADTGHGQPFIGTENT